MMTETRTLMALLPWGLLASAVGALGTAYIAELGFGYEPCVLCLYQRVPYALIAAIGLGTLFLTGIVWRRFAALAASATFAIGAAIAFYHVGVEQLWWTSAAPCGAAGIDVSNTQDFLAALQQKPEKSCGDIDWTLFGISMATYNVAVSALLAGASFLVWMRLRKETA